MHRLVEATRLAFRDRNAFVADPRMSDVPVARLLDKGYAAELRGHVRDDRAMAALPPPGLPPHEDTVYLCVVDEDGNACSFINSLFKRSEEHTSELQSLMRISYAVFCLKKKTQIRAYATSQVTIH